MIATNEAMNPCLYDIIVQSIILFTSSTQMSIFVTGIFYSVIIAVVASLFEAIGKHHNEIFFGKILWFLGALAQVIIGTFFVWHALLLVNLPLNQWPIVITQNAYIYVNILYVIILALAALFCITVLAMIFSKIAYRKEVKKTFSRTINFLMLVLKSIIILGAVAWGFVVTQSQLTFNGIQGSSTMPFVVMMILAAFFLILVPLKTRSGKKIIVEKRKLKHKKK